jgi:hypothetical protein
VHAILIEAASYEERNNEILLGRLIMFRKSLLALAVVAAFLVGLAFAPNQAQARWGYGRGYGRPYYARAYYRPYARGFYGPGYGYGYGYGPYRAARPYGYYW